ncbi:hypothetical protein IAE24_30095, partial [Delftia sp. S65]|uniref:hypothetical protein n=1 Tax=Delftia sp. S65 TaxID=2767436 RepID=UPI001906EC47
LEIAGNVLLEDDDLRVVCVVRLIDEVELNAHASLLMDQKSAAALSAAPPCGRKRTVGNNDPSENYA